MNPSPALLDFFVTPGLRTFGVRPTRSGLQQLTLAFSLHFTRRRQLKSQSESAPSSRKRR